MVGAEGFEPSTSRAQGVRATKLHHTPKKKKPPNHLAGTERIELSTLGLEANMLPLHQVPTEILRLIRTWIVPALSYHTRTIPQACGAANKKAKVGALAGAGWTSKEPPVGDSVSARHTRRLVRCEASENLNTATHPVFMADEGKKCEKPSSVFTSLRSTRGKECSPCAYSDCSTRGSG